MKAGTVGEQPKISPIVSPFISPIFSPTTGQHSVLQRAKGEFGPPKKIAIFGAGQLAWMMAEAATELGHAVAIYAQSKNEPAAQGAYSLTLGEFDHTSAMRDFVRGFDVALIESELFPTGPLRQVLEELQIPLVPSFAALEVTRNKLAQKKLYQRLGLKSAGFVAFDPDIDHSGDHEDDLGKDLTGWLQEVKGRFPGGFALKWAEGGYDGKGVLLMQKHDLDNSRSLVGSSDFMTKALKRKIAVYAEELVPFAFECALISCARASVHPDVPLHYPLMISVQERGTCSLVYNTGLDQGTRQKVQNDAEKAAQTIIKELGMTGTFAIEFFLTSPGEQLLINEMAPRVHNSGHISQKSGFASQFHNHILAALGAKLQQPKMPPHYAMVNILGPDHYRGPVHCPEIPKLAQKAELYWYNKALSQPRRKLGHINLEADSAQELQKSIDTVRDSLHVWAEALPDLEHQK